MRTTTLTTPRSVRIDYPNSIAFMYSRQPVIVTFPGGASDVESVTATVTCKSTGRTYSESRTPYDSRADFDISRIMQLLAPDVDLLFQRLDHNAGRSLSEAFTLSVSYRATNGNVQGIITEAGITAMYGALDAGEIYGAHNQRRLWVNFPQTFNLWTDEQGDTAFVLSDAYIYPDTVGAGPCWECDLIGAMLDAGDLENFRKMLPGRTLHNIGLTWRTRIEKGVEVPEEFRTVTLVPDYSKPGDGTYLRWLNRRGEVSYCLFKNSELRVTSAVDNNFSKYYEGDPTVPVSGAYTNSQKADYREARELILGAAGLSFDEFEDVCDLATSPLIERLMPDVPEEDTDVQVVYDGGTAGTDSGVVVDSEAGDEMAVYGGKAAPDRLEAAQYVWQRVTVAAGSYSRNIRRRTPNGQDVEIVIELPERNTIKL